MCYSNADFAKKRVHDAWGSWGETIDDRELPEKYAVRFTFTETHFHKVTVVVDPQLADAIYNGEMTDEVKDFLDSDEGQEVAGYLSEINKPSWVMHEDDPVVECVEVLFSDQKGV